MDLELGFDHRSVWTPGVGHRLGIRIWSQAQAQGLAIGLGFILSQALNYYLLLVQELEFGHRLGQKGFDRLRISIQSYTKNYLLVTGLELEFGHRLGQEGF